MRSMDGVVFLPATERETKSEHEKCTSNIEAEDVFVPSLFFTDFFPFAFLCTSYLHRRGGRRGNGLFGQSTTAATTTAATTATTTATTTTTKRAKERERNRNDSNGDRKGRICIRNGDTAGGPIDDHRDVT